MDTYVKITLIFFSFGACIAKKSISFEKAEITYMNPKYGEAKVYSNKINATTFLVNARINFTKDIPTDAVITVNIYKLSDNTYKKTALSMRKNICSFFKSGEYKIMWSSHLEENFNMPKKCPIEKGFYSATDIDPNMIVANEFFNFLPSWSIKIEAAMLSKNELILSEEFCFKVIETY